MFPVSLDDLDRSQRLVGRLGCGEGVLKLGFQPIKCVLGCMLLVASDRSTDTLADLSGHDMFP